MKLFRYSRLFYLLGGIAVTCMLADFGFHGTPVLDDVSQPEAISDESSFTKEPTKPSALRGDSALRQANRRAAAGSAPRAHKQSILNTENVFISVKTTPKYYENRTRVLKMTWFQVVKKDKLSIVSDSINYGYHDVTLFETELIKEGFHLVLTNCTVAHERHGLCCKSGTEYEQFYAYLDSHRRDKHQLEWFCHFDDDVYVNIKELMKLLLKYNSSKPYYIGRNPRGPNGKVLNKSAFRRVKEHFQVKENVYLYSAGAAYCISLPLMIELKDYFNGPKQFMRTCDITGVTDDLTIGVIIDMVLGYKLINTETMYTQSVNLIHLNKKNLTKLITFGYRTDTKYRIRYIIDPQPRLKALDNQDPTRDMIEMQWSAMYTAKTLCTQQRCYHFSLYCLEE